MVSWLGSKQLGSLLTWTAMVLRLIILNQLSAIYFARLDLTEEKRYSIKPATKELLAELDDDIYVDIYLDGELNAGFKRLQRAIRETLQEFEIYSDHKLKFSFKDPQVALSQRSRNDFMSYLSSLGITPTNVIDTRDGNRVEKLIFPGAVITYGGIEEGVMLLSGTHGEEQLNSSIENVEFNLASAIDQLTRISRKKVGFIQGHGELTGSGILSFQNTLFEFYDIEEIHLPSGDIPDGIDIAIIAKPRWEWSELDKFKLDQYIMKGGKAIFLLDMLDANMDSANNVQNISFPYNIKLEDMLFRYGVRVNPDLIQDNNAAVYPIVVGNMGDQAQIVPLPWPFYPIVNRFADHPVSRNLDGILLRFASSIDTVKADGISKTPLLYSSEYSRAVQAPVKVSVADLRQNLRPEDLTVPNIPMAYLLEGAFTSVYRNRFLPEGVGSDFIQQGKSSKILVVGDGDIILNDLPEGEEVPELGTFRDHPGMHFANGEFLLNAISYMVDQEGIITARNKKVTIRPLDDVKISRERNYWQVLNILLPLILTAMLGILLMIARKARYAKFGAK